MSCVFPVFRQNSLCFDNISKFPVFSLEGIFFCHFPSFPCAVGTLYMAVLHECHLNQTQVSKCYLMCYLNVPIGIGSGYMLGRLVFLFIIYLDYLIQNVFFVIS